MQTTSNYKLKKPDGTDPVEIQDFNNNADILDAELAKRAGKATATTGADGLMSKTDKSKLDGIAAGANNYTHPGTHPANMISQDASNRFTSDSEKLTWNNHVNSRSNPHGITPAQIGAATSSEVADLKKSVSDGKQKVAAAITAKGQSTAQDAAFDLMATNISKIQTGVDTSSATADASKLLSGYTAYSKGSKITGTIPSRGAATITPSTANQTIPAGQYLSGTQTMAGDADLVSANIKAGANIFGLAGKRTVVDTADANAAASQIISGKIAYVNGNRISGTATVTTLGGKGYATGIVKNTSENQKYIFPSPTGPAFLANVIEITGLTFTPKVVLSYSSSSLFQWWYYYVNNSNFYIMNGGFTYLKSTNITTYSVLGVPSGSEDIRWEAWE